MQFCRHRNRNRPTSRALKDGAVVPPEDVVQRASASTARRARVRARRLLRPRLRLRRRRLPQGPIV